MPCDGFSIAAKSSGAFSSPYGSRARSVRRLRMPSCATSVSGSIDSVSRYGTLSRSPERASTMLSWIFSSLVARGQHRINRLAHGQIPRQFRQVRDRDSAIRPHIQRVDQIPQRAEFARIQIAQRHQRERVRQRGAHLVLVRERLVEHGPIRGIFQPPQTLGRGCAHGIVFVVQVARTNVA